MPDPSRKNLTHYAMPLGPKESEIRYRGFTVGLVLPAYGESARIGEVVRGARATGVVTRLVVVDDGSTDGTAEAARGAGAEVFRHESRLGVGAALRTGLTALAADCELLAVMAGNGKDDPRELARLLDPIADGQADFVQGSRYAPGGAALGGMPAYRRIATRLHPWIFRWATGLAVTESTNGFRAFRRWLVEDPRICLAPAALDGYALEPYLFARAVQCRYRVAEVAVTKTYPANGPYTKMRPGKDWWALIRPLVCVKLGFRV